jgi:thiamine pyrophosphate-dependent acetolactate synthase large subunit-like protein
MVALTGRIFQSGRNVGFFQERIILEDFSPVSSGSKQVKHVANAYPQAAQAWPAATLTTIESDPMNFAHS